MRSPVSVMIVGKPLVRSLPKLSMREHNREKPCECTDRGKAFSKSAHLIHHQRIHTGENPYECSDYGKAFSQHSQFNQHPRIRTGEKPSECTACGKAFQQSSYLIQHQRIHSGEPPYPFSQRITVTSHEKILNIHLGEEAYRCEKCGEL